MMNLWRDPDFKQPISPQLYDDFVKHLGQELTERNFIRSKLVPFGSEVEEYAREDQRIKEKKAHKRTIKIMNLALWILAGGCGVLVLVAFILIFIEILL